MTGNEIDACLKDKFTGTKEKSTFSSSFTANTERTLFYIAASKVALLFANSLSFPAAAASKPPLPNVSH